MSLVTNPQSLAVLKAAWDQGINTFDTANLYSNGHSERVLGKFIKQVCLHLSRPSPL